MKRLLLLPVMLGALLSSALAQSTPTPYNPATAPNYPSPNFYRPNMDGLTIQGAGGISCSATGNCDVSKLLVVPDNTQATNTLAKLFGSTNASIASANTTISSVQSNVTSNTNAIATLNSTVSGLSTQVAGKAASGANTDINSLGPVTLANGATAANQAAGDNSSKLANTRYVDAAVAAAGSGGGGQAAAVPTAQPMGRLTLASGTPVMISPASAATSVYYTPYVGNMVPLWSGAAFVNTAFTERTLSTSGLSAGNVYDVCLWNNSGTPTAVFSPAWSAGTSGSNTARGSGAGSAQLTRVNGVLVNANAFSGGPAAGFCTYVGTIATDPGAASVSFNTGSAASGGGAATIGVWNAYNRVTVSAMVRDTTSVWNYSTSAWRAANNSANNRTTFVTGSQEETWEGVYVSTMNSSATAAASTAVGLNSTTAPAPNSIAAEAGPVGGNPSVTASTMSPMSIANVQGLNYFQALEYGNSGPASFYGASYSGLVVKGRY